jgi:hypothetical protein
MHCPYRNRLGLSLAKLLRSGGSRAVIAENLLLKQQLIIHSRSRLRAPNLSTRDRALLGFWSLFLNPTRIVRAAIIIKPSTLLSFHNALKNRKYRLLHLPRGGRKPGPKGPRKEVIDAITTSIGAILAGMARLQSNHAAILSAISNSIDGRHIAEVCFSFRRLLELGIRQGQPNLRSVGFNLY